VGERGRRRELTDAGFRQTEMGQHVRRKPAFGGHLTGIAGKADLPYASTSLFKRDSREDG
jgi:hypothetical protein